jgi:hypothetical protein
MVKKFMAPGNKPSEICDSNLYDSYRSKWANDQKETEDLEMMERERFAEQQRKFYTAWREVITEEQCMKMTLDYKDTPELLQKQQQEQYFGTDYTVRYSESTMLSC